MLRDDRSQPLLMISHSKALPNIQVSSRLVWLPLPHHIWRASNSKEGLIASGWNQWWRFHQSQKLSTSTFSFEFLQKFSEEFNCVQVHGKGQLVIEQISPRGSVNNRHFVESTSISLFGFPISNTISPRGRKISIFVEGKNGKGNARLNLIYLSSTLPRIKWP